MIMSILNVNVHTMTVTKCKSDKCMGLRCRRLSADLLAWEDIQQVSSDRVLRIDNEEFRGNVFLTNAFGATPDFSQVPKLRFYEPGWVHLSTISVSTDGTPWIMCMCDDKCGKCTDHQKSPPL